MQLKAHCTVLKSATVTEHTLVCTLQDMYTTTFYTGGHLKWPCQIRRWAILNVRRCKHNAACVLNPGKGKPVDGH